MPTSEPKDLVIRVLSAIKEEQSDSQITRLIVDSGVPAECAPNALSSIREGFKAGTVSIVMGTGMDPEADEFYRHAFSRGRAAMRFTTPTWVLLRWAIPALLVLVILGYVLTRLF